MEADFNALSASLRGEIEIMAELLKALEAEQKALAAGDFPAMGRAAENKERLVLALDSARADRRRVSGLPEGRGLGALARRAPGEWGPRLMELTRRAADLAEKVLLLNRGNGRLLEMGRAFVQERMDALRYRAGRVVLYGRRRDYVSVGGASVVQRDL